MAKSSRLYSVVGTAVSILMLAVAVCMVLALFIFSGIKLYIILGGGVLLLINLYFVRYFFKRNAVSPIEKHKSKGSLERGKTGLLPDGEEPL